MKTKTLFVCHALEWGLVGQGETLEKALASMEYLLMSQHALDQEYPNSERKPAPEDVQRLRDSGDTYLPTSTWLRNMFPDGLPVVDRRDIDMAKTEWKIVEKTNG